MPALVPVGGWVTWGSHLFQRVASFLPGLEYGGPTGGSGWFSSLSESGFIPTKQKIYSMFLEPRCSHLFQRVASFLLVGVPGFQVLWFSMFSSLSESGFIPTRLHYKTKHGHSNNVLISFREWLHSYWQVPCARRHMKNLSSHLFQRVASFLQVNDLTLILRFLSRFSSLSESGFIPTEKKDTSFSKEGGWVLISFREWLHSYWV